MVFLQTKNSNLGLFLECLCVEIVGIFYDYLVYFTVIWLNLFPTLGMLYQEKSGNPSGRGKPFM
jgi:hypothetical protein